jgi:hypothetical protein
MFSGEHGQETRSYANSFSLRSTKVTPERQALLPLLPSRRGELQVVAWPPPTHGVIKELPFEGGHRGEILPRTYERN